jgi:hypothetical protein
VLHVTNGDAAVSVMRAAGIEGDILPWRDVLHEGPVPAGLPLAALSDLRARFIAEAGFGAYEDIRRDFAIRDAALLAAGEVTLWFEHDLYDQLQLVQILDALRGRGARIWLVQADSYLGRISPSDLAALRPLRAAVTETQVALAARAWDAFRASEPARLQRLCEEVPGELPFLAPALRRHLEEFPAPTDGLSRTERQILAAVERGASSFAAVFAATQAMEEAIFMGDIWLGRHLDRLQAGARPLLTRDPLALTEDGRAVLAGKLDNLALNGIDHWLGGVHLRRAAAV